VLSIGCGKDFFCLIKIEVVKDVVPDRAGNAVNRTFVQIELVQAHPKNPVVNGDSGIRALNCDVLRDFADTKGKRRAEILHRVERDVGKNDGLLAGFHRNDNLGPRANAQVAGAVGRPRFPVGHRFLARKPNKQRVLRLRGCR
jgi:hypothetical protein